jgi:hypothetical protein
MPLRFKLVASVLVGMMECTLFSTGRAAESRRTIFVSATSGRDANDGLSQQTPWRSLARVNAAELRPGDRVLFQRGDTWRGQLVPRSGRQGAPITYGAYGQGARPVLLGSISRNDPHDWHRGATAKLAPSSQELSLDVGNIIFDRGNSVGVKKWKPEDLKKEGDYWYCGDTWQVKLVSERNPIEVHESLELALRRHIVEQSNQSHVFEHNTCVNAGFGWGHAQCPDPNGRHLMFWANTARTSEFSVRENIFCNATDGCLRIDNDWTDGLSLDRNYWSQTAGVLMQFLRTQFVAPQFTEYQKQARLDTHSIVADPKFVNSTALDFRLSKDSPPRKLGAAGGSVGAVKRLEK